MLQAQINLIKTIFSPQFKVIFHRIINPTKHNKKQIKKKRKKRLNQTNQTNKKKQKSAKF